MSIVRLISGNLLKRFIETMLIGYAIRIPAAANQLDHTYVGYVENDPKNPIYSWKCHGRDKGGEEICRGNGDPRTANCLSHEDSNAGLIYGVSGVCHQMANRILLPAGVIVSDAKGFGLSTFTYGIYGQLNPVFFATLNPLALIAATKAAKKIRKEWSARKARCLKTKKSLSQPSGSKKLPSGGSPEQVFLQQVIDLHASVLTKSAIGDDVFSINDKDLGEEEISKLELGEKELREKEFKLFMEYRLGKELNLEITELVLKAHSEFNEEKSKADANLLGDDISIDEYVNCGNEHITEVLAQIAKDMNDDAKFKALYDISPPKDTFILIEPEIAAKVHGEKGLLKQLV